MATTTILDYRRDDVRRYDHHTRYWVTSAEISAVDSDDLAALVFSFPAARYGSGPVLVHNVGFKVTEIFAGGTITVDVGACTLATDGVTTAGVSTDVDKDEYVPTGDITSGTLGIYWPDGGDWFTAHQADLNAAPVLITPADTTVPAIAVYVTSDAAITGGKGRVLLEISEVPIV